MKGKVYEFCTSPFNENLKSYPKRISKRPILNGRGNRKIKGEVTSIKVVRHLAGGVKLQENA